MRTIGTQVILSFFLIGFASIANAEKQKGLPSLEIPEGKAAIYIYRDKKGAGAFVKHWFFFNRSVGLPMGNGNCSAAIVDVGRTLVEVESGVSLGAVVTTALEKLLSDPYTILNLDVDAGKSYYLKFILNEKDTLAPTPLGHSLFLVPRDEALKSTSKCKFRDPSYVPADIGA